MSSFSHLLSPPLFPILHISYFLIFLFFIFFSLSSITSKQLLFVVTHISQGAHEPIRVFNNTGKSYMKNTVSEKGKVTPVGERMLYILGSKNREKYDNFIGKNYSKDEVLIESIIFKRSYKSANAFVQGLYHSNNSSNLSKYSFSNTLKEEQIKISFPPLNENELNSKYIHEVMNNLGNKSMIKNVEIKIKKNKKLTRAYLCKKSKEMLKKNIISEEIKNLTHSFNLLYSLPISIFLGLPHKKLSKNFIFLFCDSFIADRASGKPLEFLNFVSSPNAFEKDCEEFYFRYLYNKFFKRNQTVEAEASFSLRRMLGFMNKRIKKDNDKDNNKDKEKNKDKENIKEKRRKYKKEYSPKYYLISGNEYTIFAWEKFFIEYFGIENKLINPYYASQIQLELYREGDDDKKNYYIQYSINNKILIQIPFNDFEKIIKDKTFNENQFRLWCSRSKKIKKSFIPKNDNPILNEKIKAKREERINELLNKKKQKIKEL